MTVRLSNKILRCTKCNFQKKEWSDVTKNDIDDFVTNLMERYSDDGAETEYTRDHKKTLKSFFIWTKYGYGSKEDCINEHGVGDPPETRHVKKRNPDSKLRASDLITDQEREWLLDVCDHPVDAFLVDVPLDAGLRPCEIFNVTIWDIKQDKYGFKMDVDDKTGIRPVRLVKSTPTIALWLNSHPFKENRDPHIFTIDDSVEPCIIKMHPDQDDSYHWKFDLFVTDIPLKMDRTLCDGTYMMFIDFNSNGILDNGYESLWHSDYTTYEIMHIIDYEKGENHDGKINADDTNI